MYNIFEPLHDSQQGREGGWPTIDILEAFPGTEKQLTWERGGLCSAEVGLWGPVTRRAWSQRHDPYPVPGSSTDTLVFICSLEIHLTLLGIHSFALLSGIQL